METTKTTVLLFAGLVALTACQPQEQPAGEAGAESAVDTTAVMESLDSLRSAYQQAVAEGEYERLGDMVSAGALMVSAGGAGWDSARAASGEAPFPPGATLDITPHETRVLSGDWAYEIGSGAVTWTPEGADEERTVTDTYLVLLHRTADGWKVHREVASSRPLPDEGT